MSEDIWAPGPPAATPPVAVPPPAGDQPAMPGMPGMPAYGTPPPATAARRRGGRVLGPLAAAAAALAKYGVILVKLKAFVVVGTMLVSVAAYAWLFGWPFAVGLVALIFVHESGHVLALRRRGIKAGPPVFLPFLGAFVSMKSTPRSVYEEAETALAGPLVGTVGAIALAYVAHLTGSPLLRALAFTGFLINLFNLMPALPLDGGRAAGALHPGLWLVGLLGLLGYELYRPSPVIPIILVIGGLELWRRWRGRDSAASRAYHALTRAQRGRIAGWYVGIAVVLVIGLHMTYVARHF